MLLPLCKFCGERHPLLKCPEFDIVEQTQVLINQAKAEIAKGLLQTDLSVPDEQVRIARHDNVGGAAEQPGAGLCDKVLTVAGPEVEGDGGPAAGETAVQHKDFDGVGLAGDLDALQGPVARQIDGHDDHDCEHPVPKKEHRKPHRYTVQPNSERNLEPWKALGISRRTYYRRKATA